MLGIFMKFKTFQEKCVKYILFNSLFI